MRGAAGKQIKDTMEKVRGQEKKDKKGRDTKTKHPGRRRRKMWAGFAKWGMTRICSAGWMCETRPRARERKGDGRREKEGEIKAAASEK